MAIMNEKGRMVSVGSSDWFGSSSERRSSGRLLESMAEKLLGSFFDRLAKPTIENHASEIADDDKESPRKPRRRSMGLATTGATKATCITSYPMARGRWLGRAEMQHLFHTSTLRKVLA